MNENIWKEIFKDEVFKIDGKEYKLADLVAPDNGMSEKKEPVILAFLPVNSDVDSDIITIEVPTSSIFLLAKYLVTFKGTFGDFFAKFEEAQEELEEKGVHFVSKLQSACNAFFDEMKKGKEGDK